MVRVLYKTASHSVKEIGKEGCMMEQSRLEKQLEFCKEIDKEKFIQRQTYLTDGQRKENDAEHAWHMAIMIYLLKEYANEEFDVTKAMMMALIHDIVEIDAIIIAFVTSNSSFAYSFSK